MTETAGQHFAILLGGSIPAGETPLGKTLGYVSKSAGETLDNLISLRAKKDKSELLIYGAFLGRLLIEATTTAVIGRLDPFRLLILQQLQSSDGYDVGEPQKLSINWQEDVLLSDGSKSDSKRPLSSYSRAILGDSWEKIAWKPAFNNFLDAFAEKSETDWSAKVTNYEAHTFLPRVRQEFKKLYSTFSKGIHLEFVCPPQDKFDVDTLETALDDAIFYSVLLGSAVNFVDHAAYQLQPSETVEHFLAIETYLMRR